MKKNSHFIAFLILVWILPANSETSDVNGWELVWSDEFDGEKLDISKWTYDVDCWGGGNNERQCYTDKEENVKLEDGFLKITALKKRSKGYSVPQIARDGYIPNPTSSKKFEKNDRPILQDGFQRVANKRGNMGVLRPE